MIITYLRSSSYNNFDYCQMQYYMNYVLGLPRTSGKRADKGTVVHKVMECLAALKKEHQRLEKDKVSIQDDSLGLITVNWSDWLSPRQLSNKEIDDVNRTRINKNNYKHDCKLNYGHIRYGEKLVNELILKSYEHYSSKSSEEWTKADFKDCTNWVWMTLSYQGGAFDPRRRTIVDTEPHFDIQFSEDWANYEYNLPNGKKINGKLSIKGTVDLITDLGDDTYEIIDWKTGQRKDWATDEKKDYKKLCTDAQLQIYYFAVKNKYPNAKHIIVSIFFVRDGGPYSLCFSENDIPMIKDKIKDRFLEIKNCNTPYMVDASQKDFRCTRICDYYKSKIGKQNTCKHINEQIQLIGIDAVTKKYTNPDFNVGYYESPGS